MLVDVFYHCVVACDSRQVLYVVHFVHQGINRLIIAWLVVARLLHLGLHSGHTRCGVLMRSALLCLP